MIIKHWQICHMVTNLSFFFFLETDYFSGHEKFLPPSHTEQVQLSSRKMTPRRECEVWNYNHQFLSHGRTQLGYPHGSNHVFFQQYGGLDLTTHVRVPDQVSHSQRGTNHADFWSTKPKFWSPHFNPSSISDSQQGGPPQSCCSQGKKVIEPHTWHPSGPTPTCMCMPSWTS